jgi:hypothetical protein
MNPSFLILIVVLVCFLILWLTFSRMAISWESERKALRSADLKQSVQELSVAYLRVSSALTGLNEAVKNCSKAVEDLTQVLAIEEIEELFDESAK